MKKIDFPVRQTVAFGLFVGVALTFGLLSANPAKANGTSPKVTAPHSGDRKIFAKAYGDWVYRCVQITQAGKPAITACEIFQQMLLATKDGKKLPLVTLGFEKADGQPGYMLNALLPLGIFLPPGVSFWADNQSPVTALIGICETNGCLAPWQPSEGLTAELRAGKVGHARMVLTDGHPVTFNFSLNGFNAALEALDKGGLPPEIRTPGTANPDHAP